MTTTVPRLAAPGRTPSNGVPAAGAAAPSLEHLATGGRNGGAPTTKRVALVLVPGVGEEGPGETAHALMGGLTRLGRGYRGGDRTAMAIDVPSTET